MKRGRDVLIRTIPVAIVVAVTILISLAIYKELIRYETEECWDYLEFSTNVIADEVGIRLSDNLSILKFTADAITMYGGASEQEELQAYLESAVEATIFDRIDIMYADGTVVLNDGSTFHIGSGGETERLMHDKSIISNRVVDIVTGQEVIYCSAPVMKEGKTEALLMGIISCETLDKIFAPQLYDGDAHLFIFDREDGSFLVDEWHEKLGNVKDLSNRKRMTSYENVDFIQEIMDGKKGTVGLYSAVNGKETFMHYEPVEGVAWEVCVWVQDDIVFDSVYTLMHILFWVGILELSLLMAAFGWNVFSAYRTIKAREELQRLEVERMANETKARFLSSVSHDIRTPINGIIGMLDIAKKHENEPARVKECIHKIGVASDYLMTLVNDVLDLNEIENSNLSQLEESVNLQELVDDLDVLVRLKTEEAGINYHIETQIEHYCVRMNIAHVRRILVNLITNAIKYNKPNGDVWFNVKEIGSEEKKITYEFEIRDNGIGMTEEFQKNMFESFEQENMGARSEYQGHGLGLPIVKRLVDNMNGTIRVESSKNVGSLFVVRLSFVHDQEMGKGKKQETGVHSDLTGVKILLVEDNEMNMEIAQTLLTEAGAKVVIAGNGKEAVDIFKESEPFEYDIILMDIMMPVMDGLEATRTIRAMVRPEAKEIPIIAMSANSFSSDIERSMKAGMNEHIAKPIDTKVLINKVYKYID